ncbi:hypothetical protein Taro_055940 [Colocasia esculenta]|uniref:SKP1 component POZ domain-containing protein n=1 Tax=Colocasia esculenta TaxID=4460 RepID=A0A843XUR7_COLES|nr:hypothetical protein [Colocasia esculenta]
MLDKTVSSSSSSSMGEIKKVVLLRSYDGVEFEVEESLAGLSETINHAMEDAFAIDDVIPLHPQHHQEHSRQESGRESWGGGEGGETTGKDLKEWDEVYIDIDMGTLYHLILAMNYLEVKELLELPQTTTLKRKR